MVLLLKRTVIIDVKNDCGQSIKAKIFLDSGLQYYFTMKDFAQPFNLSSLKIDIPVEGLLIMESSVKQIL